MPLRDKGKSVLRDLIALQQVGIVVILAVELGELGDFAVESKSCHDGRFDRGLIDDRESPRHTEADRADVCVRKGPKNIRGTTAEHLGFGEDLGVNFEADDRLEFE